MTILQRNERLQMVKAMEYIARCINNEDIAEPWLICGVADGDIPFGEVAVKSSDKVNLEYYIQDENFAELMRLFLSLMSAAKKDGGLYNGGIVS